MSSPRLARPWSLTARALPLALGLAISGPAAADSLFTQPDPSARGYTPVEELSYELIIEPSGEYGTRLLLRTALHNDSASRQDAVLHFALPRGTELEHMRVARGGKWIDAVGTGVSPAAVERDESGSIYARLVPPDQPDGLPIAELVLYDMEPDATVQVELACTATASLRGDRWELELPHRGSRSTALSAQRRVIVRGLRPRESFWVDDTPSGDALFMTSRAEDAVTVAWPAHVSGKRTLEGHYEILPSDFGGGRVRLMLRLGLSAPARPDHVLLLVDTSTSVSSELAGNTRRLTEKLFAALPAETTFDALAFDRHVSPLIRRDDADAPPRIDDPGARGRLAASLERARQGQGTDIERALLAAANAVRASGARRPMVVVVTDGSLPASVDPEQLADAVEARLAEKQTLEVLFVIDDPLLMRQGLPPDHPVSRLAAALGGRISLQSLEFVQSRADDSLLAAPRVLGRLRLGFPSSVELDEVPPSGLVSGNFLAIEGQYRGKPPSSIKVSGRSAGKTLSVRLTAQRHPSLPEALAANTETDDLRSTQREGFSMPRWYARQMTEEARAGIRRASGTGTIQAGLLTPEISQHYLRTRVLPRARACYNKALGRNGVQAGRVVLEMEVGKGEVMLARVGTTELIAPDEKLLGCLEDAAWALTIPAAEQDTRVYRIRYPITFTAPEGGKAPSANDGNDPFVDLMVQQADILAR